MIPIAVVDQLKPIPSYIQPHGSNDCGAIAFKIIAEYFGKKIDLYHCRLICNTSNNGTSLFSLKNALSKINLDSMILECPFSVFTNSDLDFPIIVLDQQKHFFVVYHINDSTIYISDPLVGLIEKTHSTFLNNWLDSTTKKGYCLVILRKN